MRRVIGALRARAERRGIILLYHSVARRETDPWSLAVTPEHFAEHLDVVRRVGRPLSLAAAHAAARAGTLPRRAVVVTFDDGYADNLHAARPLLERFAVPATVFVATGGVGADEEFWWDALDRVLLAPRDLPPALALDVGGAPFAWTLGDAAAGDAAAGPAARAWRAEDPAPTSRQTLFLALWERLRPLAPPARAAALASLRAWAGAAPGARPTHRCLTAGEVGRLAAGGLVEVGAHTVTHPSLPAVPPDERRREVAGSRARLEELTGAPVRSFAYPFGRPGDVDAATAGLVRELGFARACVNGGGLLRGVPDAFRLPRRYVFDWDGDRFAAALTRWLRAPA